MARFVIPESRPIYGWHLARPQILIDDDLWGTGSPLVEDGVPVAQMNYIDQASIRQGDTVTARGKQNRGRLNGSFYFGRADQRLVNLCRCGPHCSLTPLDSLVHGFGTVLSFVAMTGHAHLTAGVEKMVSQHRRHLCMVDASDVLEAIGWESGGSWCDDREEYEGIVRRLGSKKEKEENTRLKETYWTLTDAFRVWDNNDLLKQHYARLKRISDRQYDLANTVLDRIYRDLFTAAGHPDLPKTYFQI